MVMLYLNQSLYWISFLFRGSQKSQNNKNNNRSKVLNVIIYKNCKVLFCCSYSISLLYILDILMIYFLLTKSETRKGCPQPPILFNIGLKELTITSYMHWSCICDRGISRGRMDDSKKLRRL
jgi:hypothetical protein